MKRVRPPLAAPAPGRSYVVRAEGGERILLVVSVGDRPDVVYPSRERWWPVTAVGPGGPEVAWWGEYSADRWRELR